MQAATVIPFPMGADVASRELVFSVMLPVEHHIHTLAKFIAIAQELGANEHVYDTETFAAAGLIEVCCYKAER